MQLGFALQSIFQRTKVTFWASTAFRENYLTQQSWGGGEFNKTELLNSTKNPSKNQRRGGGDDLILRFGCPQYWLFSGYHGFPITTVWRGRRFHHQEVRDDIIPCLRSCWFWKTTGEKQKTGEKPFLKSTATFETFEYSLIRGRVNKLFWSKIWLNPNKTTILLLVPLFQRKTFPLFKIQQATVFFSHLILMKTSPSKSCFFSLLWIRRKVPQNNNYFITLFVAAIICCLDTNTARIPYGAIAVITLWEKNLFRVAV